MKLGLIIEGGIGDMIGYTTLFRNLHNEGHELYVTSAFPEIFEGNPHLTSSIDFEYDTWFQEMNKICDRIVRKDFYRENAVGKFGKHYTEVMCEMHNTTHDNIYPDYYVTEEEDNFAKEFLSEVDNGKPTILMQTQCGINPKEGFLQNTNKSWKMEYVADFTKLMKKDYNLLHIGLPEEPSIPNTIPIKNLSVRQIVALLKHVDSFLGIDSFLQHASACVNKKGVVLWGKSPQEVFAWQHNVNLAIKSECQEQPCGRANGSLFDLQLFEDGQHRNWECPNYICQDIPAELVSKTFREQIFKS